jgi:hypothetical protein
MHTPMHSYRHAYIDLHTCVHLHTSIQSLPYMHVCPNMCPSIHPSICVHPFHPSILEWMLVTHLIFIFIFKKNPKYIFINSFFLFFFFLPFIWFSHFMCFFLGPYCFGVFCFFFFFCVGVSTWVLAWKNFKNHTFFGGWGGR